MTSPEDFAALRTRVDRLETGLADVRRIASTAQGLARLADRDVSDIRASHAAIMRSMEALRETQVEMQADLTERLGVVRDGVATIIGLLRDAS